MQAIGIQRFQWERSVKLDMKARFAIAALAERGPMNNAQLLQVLGVPRSTWFKLVARLTATGCVERRYQGMHGRGAAAVYAATGKPYPDSPTFQEYQARLTRRSDARAESPEAGLYWAPSPKEVAAACEQVRRTWGLTGDDPREARQRHWATVAQAERARVRAERRAV